jgi:hypothetical protein
MKYNEKYNDHKKEFIEFGFKLLNDDGEYLIGYKVHPDIEQIELIKINIFEDEKVVQVALDWEEINSLVKEIELCQ